MESAITLLLPDGPGTAGYPVCSGKMFDDMKCSNKTLIYGNKQCFRISAYSSIFVQKNLCGDEEYS